MHCSWLKAHRSWLKEDSWLLAKKKGAQGPPVLGPFAPRFFLAMGLEPMAMSLEPSRGLEQLTIDNRISTGLIINSRNWTNAGWTFYRDQLFRGVEHISICIIWIRPRSFAKDARMPNFIVLTCLDLLSWARTGLHSHASNKTDAWISKCRFGSTCMYNSHNCWVRCVSVVMCLRYCERLDTNGKRIVFVLVEGGFIRRTIRVPRMVCVNRTTDVEMQSRSKHLCRW